MHNKLIEKQFFNELKELNFINEYNGMNITKNQKYFYKFNIVLL